MNPQQEQINDKMENEDHYATCNGCGIGMTENEIKYTSNDGSDYCNDCYEAIQGDDESSGRLDNHIEIVDTVREAAKAEMGVDYEPHMSQNDQSFIHGAEFGAAWQKEHSYSEQEQWVSVNDRLPDEGGRYWCYVIEINDLGKSGFQWNCYFDDRDKSFRDNHQSMIVTHWRKLMPIPVPPKQ